MCFRTRDNYEGQIRAGSFALTARCLGLGTEGAGGEGAGGEGEEGSGDST